MREVSPIRRRESVCRSLFGPVDHEQLSRDLTKRLREITEQDSRRWNFNFQAETPLLGRFEWEEVPSCCTAAFYQERDQPEQEPAEDSVSGAGSTQSTEMDRENCPSLSNTKRPAEVTPVRRKRAHSKPAAKAGNNAKITDFFVKRRRSTDSLSPFNTYSSEVAPYKTIR
ncbi:cyclin dependent kinase inhibitor 1Ca [Genypterus blacodes]|uniref:cyclin dependent kinase inhibitor 1Ca n=1 Tax=Genypterus blacodes TaxID=154954 RepID=UPI003F75EF42